MFVAAVRHKKDGATATAARKLSPPVTLPHVKILSTNLKGERTRERCPFARIEAEEGIARICGGGILKGTPNSKYNSRRGEEPGTDWANLLLIHSQ